MKEDFNKPQILQIKIP